MLCFCKLSSNCYVMELIYREVSRCFRQFFSMSLVERMTRRLSESKPLVEICKFGGIRRETANLLLVFAKSMDLCMKSGKVYPLPPSLFLFD